jgi:hypothetical protein
VGKIARNLVIFEVNMKIMKTACIMRCMDFLKKPGIQSFPLLLVLPENLPFDQGIGAMVRIWSAPVTSNTLSFMQESWGMHRSDSYLWLALAGVAIVLSTSIRVIISGRGKKNSDTKN